jgi:hypothetical protein
LVLLIGSLGALLTLRGWQKRNVRSARPGWLQKVGSRPWRYRPRLCENELFGTRL